MANKCLCLFNKFGYCKYLDTCRKQHTKDICEIPQCEVTKCFKRHPRTCRFYQEYGRCKFGEDCYYRHNKNETNSKIVEELEKVKEKSEHNKAEADAEIECLKNKVAVLERKLEEVNIVLASGNFLDKNEKIENIERSLNVNNDSIKANAAELDKKLSDYIIVSFVR